MAGHKWAIYIIRNSLIKTYVSNYKAMSSSSSKKPPAFSQSKTYEDWLKLFGIWHMYTELQKKCQVPALILSLEGEGQDAVLEIPENDISSENDVNVIINRLNRLCKKDSTVTKYQALEAFEVFRWSCDMSIQSFLNDFEKRLYQTKSYSAKMSEAILGYRLLKSANLSNEHKQLIKATLPELQYDSMKDQLKKIFSYSSWHTH